MKALLLLLLTLPLAAHPGHSGSVHDEKLDLQAAHSEPPGESKVEIRIEGNRRLIRSNGLPDHPTGRFPSRGNPNPIREQDYTFSLPTKPEKSRQPSEVGHQLFGVALNGVVFDPATAEYYQNQRGSEWNYEALGGAVDLGLDEHHGHVQPTGAYHYHGLPTALFDELSGGEEKMTLIGWAADGFPIYGLYGYEDAEDADSGVRVLRSSYRLKSGKRQGSDAPPGEYDGTYTSDYEYVEGSGDLDECNGRDGVTPEFPDGTYHYVLTKDYPFIPRLFRGSPDPSFRKSGPGRRRGPGPGGRPLPPPGGPGGPPPPPGAGNPPPHPPEHPPRR